MERADIEKMERIRARVDSQVADPATAEALKPWYDAFCKRLCFHDDYLQTFNRPNVRLIDTQGWGVDRVGEKGVVVDGKEYELDCLIYATGFEVGTDFNRRIGFDIYGRGGQVLADKWVDGALTLHGFFSHGFPNCFMVAGVQSGQSANFHHMMDERSKHFVYVIERLRELGVRTAEPSVAAEQDWVAKVVKAAAGRQRYLQECTPGYYNLEGAAPSERTGRNGPYWRGPIDFIDALERWREDGSMPGLELTY
jgi:cyclohexanone monooxygenase